MGYYRDSLLWIGKKPWFKGRPAAALTALDRALYRISGGRMSTLHVGSSDALPTLLLTTTGAKSGRQRSTPVLYLEEPAGAVLVVASNFGRESHPAWSANLIADPRARVAIHGRERAVSARRLDAAELDQRWDRLLEIYPGWSDYRERTDRSFRAFLLEPV
jgi:deazaflavin-dependent oxidoreductase (nitroreductase family)